MAFRVDKSGSFVVRKTGAGGLVLDAALTRTGIFTYIGHGGKEIRELRPEAEVFRADSIASLRDLPVTDRHPPRAVTPQNARQYRRGHVSGEAKREDSKISAQLVLDDAELIAAVERRDRTEVSCGYTCDTDETPGVFEGKAYDRVQKNIVYNHVAIVERGRAGSEVRLRLDAAGDAEIDEAPTAPAQKAPNMKTIRIDGVDYPLNTPAEIDAMTAAHARVEKARSDEAAKVAKERETQTARADAAEEKVKKLESDLAAANDPKRLDEAVSTRSAIVETAIRALGEDFKADGLSNDEIMRKTIAKAAPSAVIEGKSADYVRARFDALGDDFAKTAKADPTGLGAARKGTQTPEKTRTDAAPDLSPSEKMRQDNAKRAQGPLAYTKDRE